MACRGFLGGGLSDRVLNKRLHNPAKVGFLRLILKRADSAGDDYREFTHVRKRNFASVHCWKRLDFCRIVLLWAHHDQEKFLSKRSIERTAAFQS